LVSVIQEWLPPTRTLPFSAATDVRSPFWEICARPLRSATCSSGPGEMTRGNPRSDGEIASMTPSVSSIW